MSLLDPDSLVMELDTLCGIHQDVVRCVFDQRVNRIKDLQTQPDEQLSELQKIATDAYTYWQKAKGLPQDYPWRRTKVAQTLSNFFNRIERYAMHHTLQEHDPAQDLQKTVIQKARNYSLLIDIYPQQTLGL